MKKFASLLIALFISFQIYAQNSPGFKYQALVRDANGVVLTKQIVNLEINLLQGIPNGSPVYSETFSVTTNDFGLINLVIGKGNTSDDFMSIDWENGPYFIEILMDVFGGYDYQLFGTSELMSVPYAMHAKTAESVTNLDITEKDPIFSISSAAAITATDIQKWNEAYDWGDHLTAGYVTLDGIETLNNKTLVNPVLLNPTGLVKADVGLANVDNTADSLKPISKPVQAALELKENMINKSTDELFLANSDTLYPSQKAVKTYVDNNGGDIQNALNDEIARATAAEEANAAAILAEETRAITSELANATTIADETARAIGADTTNANAITSEETRALAAEFANATAIADETARAIGADTTNANAITSEETRALAAELANATAIADETARAIGADTTNTNAITNEETRALAAEAALSDEITSNNTALTDETARALAAELANATAIADETARAIGADTTNANAITNEETRALAAELANATAIADETARAIGADTTNANAITNEETRALAAELANATAITNEETRALAAETANATAITNEETRALAAELANTSAITDETARAIGADTTNANAITSEETRALAAELANATAITNEETRALAAETANATAITNEETRALAAELANTSAITDETARAIGADTTNANAITSEETRALAAETANATAITNEETRALAAETANATAITNEETRALAAETANATAITNEETRALAAELANTSAITDETARAIGADTTNANAITSEETRALAAELANATAITNEETRALAAETANATAITNEETRALAAEATNATAITNEETRALAAEAANTTAISNEETRAIAAEAANTTAITNEEARAITAEATNATAITNEEARAITAEATNATAITNEEARAIAAEATLSTNIGVNTADIAAEVAARTAKPANNITSTNITNWNTAFGWGNHAGLYRAKTWVPTWSDVTAKPTTLAGYGITNAMTTAHDAYAISAANITDWNTAFGWGNHSVAGYLKVEADPVFTTSPAATITSADITAWSSPSGTEVDPVYSAAAAATIAYADITNWNAAYDWGNHSGLYRPVAWVPNWSDVAAKPTTISGFGITNAMTTSHAANAITNTNIANWNAVYGWGNHNLAGYLTAEVDPTFTASPAATITTDDITAWSSPAGTEIDPVFNAAAAFGIASGDITNWNTAYAWGNHTGLYRPVAWVPNWSDVAATPTTVEGYDITNAMTTSHAANAITNTYIANWNAAYSWGDHSLAGYITVESDPDFNASPAAGISDADITAWSSPAGTEIDPVFKASSAFGIAGADITNWNTAYGWGDHAAAGYLKTETDALFTSSAASGIASGDITNWNTAYAWGNHTGLYRPVAWVPNWSDIAATPTTVEGYDITNAMTTSHAANAITNTYIANWNAAYSWGDHSLAGYITVESDPDFNASPAAGISDADITAWSSPAGTEIDPVFKASSAFGIAGADITNWNTAYGWGDHAAAGYLKTETDALFTSSAASGIASGDITNWNAAYAWGNHTGLYRPVAWVPNWSDVAAKPTTISGFGITNAMTTSHAANAITNTYIANWNAAYSWGDHSLAGYITVESDPDFNASPAAGISDADITAWSSPAGTEIDPVFKASSAFGIAGADITNWNTAYGWGNHSGLYRPVAWVPNWTDVAATPTTVEGYDITNAMTTSHAANAITNTYIANWNAAYSWGDHSLAGYITVESDPDFNASPAAGISDADITAWSSPSGTEIDPVFKASSAFGIAGADITNWNTAYGWGDHAAAGYLKTETDALFTSSDAAGIVSGDITNWNAAYAWGNHTGLYRPVAWVPNWSDIAATPTTVEGYDITNAMTTSHAANAITNTYIANWNAAYSWGDHSLAGYITVESDPDFNASPAAGISDADITAWSSPSGTEIDPVFKASSAFGIAGADITNWNTAYGWGDHAAAGYLKTETDALFTSSDAAGIVSGDITNWNAAYAWGNHTGLYRPVAWVPNWNDVAAKPTTISGFGITNAMSTAHAANAITTINISNWNTAYGWGNHASAGYVSTESDPVFIASPASGISDADIATWNSPSGTEVDPVFTAWNKSTGISITESQISDLGTYLTSYTETDPIFTAWNKSTGISITESQISDLGTYLTSYTETDPVFIAWNKSTGISITESQITDLGTYETAFAKLTAFNKNFGTTAGTVAQGNDSRIVNGQTAYSWGDHGTEGYLTSYTETDPEFAASPAFGITDADITAWSSPSGTETDPVFTAWDKSTDISITESQISDLGSYETAFAKNSAFNKNFGTTSGTVVEGNDSRIAEGEAAYAWGDHSTAGYLTSLSETDPVYSAWNKSTGISITESQISDLGSYETAFAKNSAFNKNFGTTSGTVVEGNDSRIAEGEAAYAWGDHSTAGYLTSLSETDPVYSAWNKSTGISITESQISDLGSYETAFAKNSAFNKDFGTGAGTVAQGNDSRIDNGQTAFGWGDHSLVGYLTSESDNNTLDKAYDQGGAGLGNTIIASDGALTIGTDGIISTGIFSSGTALATAGSGTKMFWYPKKSAFRVGTVSGAQWDDANIGDYSIAMGKDVTANSNNSVALGTSVSTNSNNGSFAFGDASTTTVMNNAVANQMVMRFDQGYNLYTRGDLSIGVTLAGGANSWASISDSTKKENIISADGEYFLSSLSKMKVGSWNYKAQDKKIRHYGPMAQDIYHYFGNDSIGIIGNDTTLAAADMDGIMMIAIQALEKRTENSEEINTRVDELEGTVQELSSKLEEQSALIKAQSELLEAYRKN